jgi:hypothetical protein
MEDEKVKIEIESIEQLIKKLDPEQRKKLKDYLHNMIHKE